MKDKKIIAIFFSLGMGLETWQEKGLLSRNLPYFGRLLEEFDEIYLFTYDSGDISFFKEPRINAFPMPVKLPNTVYALFLPFIYIRRLKMASVLHTLQMSGAIPALITKFLLRKPLLLYCGYSWLKFARWSRESFFRQFLINIIERAAFKNADAVIVTEHSQAERALRFNSHPDRVFVIPNSVEVEKFRPRAAEKLKKMVFIGRLTEQKNLFSLIKAVSRIENIELDIIGSGNLREKLQKFADRSKARVRFLGNLANEQIAAELPKYKALVLPSFYEGDPKAALEAMACGIPVVASKVEGTKELIKDKITGILCGTNPSEIEGAIRIVLSDEALAENLAENARNYVVDERNFNVNIGKQIGILKSLLRSGLTS